MNKLTLYKVLGRDMLSPYQKFQYELKKWYHCEDIDMDENIDCSKGFYAVDVDGLPYSFRTDRRVFRCEVKGRRIEINEYKRRYEYIKLIEEISHKEIKERAKETEKELGYKLSEALFPFHPFRDKNRKRIVKKDRELLEEWKKVSASVWDSVGCSVRNSVGNSIRDSVGNSVGYSVRYSVRDSVGNSVLMSIGGSVRHSVGHSVWASLSASGWISLGDYFYAYVGSLFTNIKNWKYMEHEKGEYPFQPAVDLWYRGIIPCFDGEKWRLHGGKDGKILYEEEK